MPRHNAPRDLLGERFVARRMATERDRRGWSNEGLARRMTDVGCPINQSALYKIEHSDPPRRITVDELIALSRVFGIDLPDLVCNPAVAGARQLMPLLDRLRAVDAEESEAMDRAQRERHKIEEQVRKITQTPEIQAAIDAQLERSYPGDSERGQMTKEWLDRIGAPSPARSRVNLTDDEARDLIAFTEDRDDQ
jgi:transcriptional regulator with XRE-family HTH domain